MPKKSNLINETVMYSVNRETGDIVTHHLPWPRTSPRIEEYMDKGLTLERPPEALTLGNITEAGKVLKVGERFPCANCGFLAKSEFGLTVHQRRHRREVKV